MIFRIKNIEVFKKKNGNFNKISLQTRKNSPIFFFSGWKMNMLDKMMHFKNPLDLDEDLNHVLY